MSGTLVRYETKVLRKTEAEEGCDSSPRRLRDTLRDSLSTLLPPILSYEDGEDWIQYVSLKPAVPQDVKKLEGKLDSLLSRFQARETGVCPIREKLYEQTFDEVIRQVAVSSFDRGQLLAKIRDNNAQTVSTFKRLFESSVSFGLRKELGGEHHDADRRATIRQLEEGIKKLTSDVSKLELDISSIRSRESERESDANQAHLRLKTELEERNTALNTRLEALLLDPKR